MSVKNMFNKLAKGLGAVFGSGRYIHYDNTPYGSKGMRRVLEKPELKVAGLYMALSFAHATSGGGINAEDAKMLKEVGQDLCSSFLAFSVFLRSHLDNQGPSSLVDRPIDTTGRDLSQRQLTLKELSNLEVDRFVSIALMTFVSCFPAYNFYSYYQDGDLNSFIGSMADEFVFFTYFGSKAWTAHKLLNGDYVICDEEPPKHKETKKAAAPLLGQTNTP